MLILCSTGKGQFLFIHLLLLKHRKRCVFTQILSVRPRKVFFFYLLTLLLAYMFCIYLQMVKNLSISFNIQNATCAIKHTMYVLIGLQMLIIMHMPSFSLYFSTLLPGGRGHFHCCGLRHAPLSWVYFFTGKKSFKLHF